MTDGAHTDADDETVTMKPKIELRPAALRLSVSAKHMAQALNAYAAELQAIAERLRNSKPDETICGRLIHYNPCPGYHTTVVFCCEGGGDGGG